MDFGNFLDKMGSETGRTIKLPDAKKIKNNVEEKIRTEQPKPSPTPKQKPKEIVERNNIIIEEEESIEKIYEITSIIMKTIRQAFPNKSIRNMAFESVQNAIDMILGENHQPSRMMTHKPIQEKIVKSATKPTTRVMTEQEWDNMPAVSYEDEPLQVRMNTELLEEQEEQVPSQYTRHIDIKPGNGLIGVSEQDIRDLKTLAGIE